MEHAELAIELLVSPVVLTTAIVFIVAVTSGVAARIGLMLEDVAAGRRFPRIAAQHPSLRDLCRAIACATANPPTPSPERSQT